MLDLLTTFKRSNLIEQTFTTGLGYYFENVTENNQIFSLMVRAGDMNQWR